MTVANGPRGLSSSYLGNHERDYSFTPTVPGTYRLTCLDPSDDDGADASRYPLSR